MREKTVPDTADLSNKNMWSTGNNMPALREASSCLGSLEGSCALQSSLRPEIMIVVVTKHSPIMGCTSR